MYPFLLALISQVQQEGIRFFNLKNPEPTPSLAWFVLNAFFFVGVALVITIGIGIAFGSFRFWLLSKFPNNKFNGADENDLTKTFRLND